MWKSYFDSRKKRFDLGELGLPDFWVELRALVSLPKRVMTEVQNAPDDDEGKTVFQYLVVGWNLTHPETEEELPLPSEDRDVVDVLPRDIPLWIMSKVQQMSEEMNPPVVRATTSSS